MDKKTMKSNNQDVVPSGLSEMIIETVAVLIETNKLEKSNKVSR